MYMTFGIKYLLQYNIVLCVVVNVGLFSNLLVQTASSLLMKIYAVIKLFLISKKYNGGWPNTFMSGKYII